MAIGVGGAVVLAGISYVVERVQTARDAAAKRLTSAQEHKSELEGFLDQRIPVYGNWQNSVGRTLSDDPMDAERIFTDDVMGLLEMHDLAAERTSIRGGIKPYTKGTRDGFVEITLGISVEGTLRHLVEFVRDFENRPYVTRIERLRLNPDGQEDARSEGGKRSRRKDQPRGSVNTPLEVKADLTLVTLVLPKLAEVGPHRTLDADILQDPAALAEHEWDGKLRHPEEDYGQIAMAEKNLFKIYVPEPPPPPKPPKKPDPPVATADPPPVDPPPHVDPPPPRCEDCRVVSTIALEGVPYVYIEETPLDPPTRYQLNDELDYGQIVLIDPRGIVIRAPEERDGEMTRVNYYYELGATFIDRVEVDPVLHPRIAQDLVTVLNVDG